MHSHNNADALTADVRLLSEDEIHAVCGGAGVEGDVAAILVGLFFAYATGVLGDLWDAIFG